MTESTLTDTLEAPPRQGGWQGFAADWSSDQRAFKSATWGKAWGAAQFGACFFTITGFHGTHVSIGVIFLLITARKVLRGDFESGRRGFFTSRKGRYEIVETMGLYWHFVDLVWVFIFALF